MHIRICHLYVINLSVCAVQITRISYFLHAVKVNVRGGWNTLKDCQAIKYINVEILARKLLPYDAMVKWRKEKDKWLRIMEELRYFLKQKAERDLTRPRVVHALFVATGDVQFINDVLLAGKDGYANMCVRSKIVECLVVGQCVCVSVCLSVRHFLGCLHI